MLKISGLQFGKKIEEFGGVQEKLARMATLQYTAQVRHRILNLHITHLFINASFVVHGIHDLW